MQYSENSVPTFGLRVHCHREHKDTLSQACQNEVFVAEKDAANDYQMDPLLSEKCGADAQAYCSDVSPEGGRVQACLVIIFCSIPVFVSPRNCLICDRLSPPVYLF